MATINANVWTLRKQTGKLFLTSYDEGVVPKAIKEALERLQISYVDQVVVAFPTSTFTQQQQEHPWGALEQLVDSGEVLTIGASDLDLSHLSQLHKWARIKPAVNQVNLESCCVMPLDMTAYAKENNIQLLTHSDPRANSSCAVILPEDQTPQLLNRLISEENQDEWKLNWIIRFSVSVKSRGILQSMGYLISMNQE
ncbi:GCLM [Cordylochernes scorpioides]|uniref:GCS light chain n=1 Tax=Cordylochernes scorpioides TaxID=51811 RepID=A0ABY6L9Z3_9ARAC|nr:GCLM [Cordylochernes scorpioides]